MKFSERLRSFREGQGFSQQEFAELLGIGRITVVRWENGTSKPSSLAAEKLERVGFGKISRNDTKDVSTPRLSLNGKGGQSTFLPNADIRKSINIGSTVYGFNPSPYVLNGPEDQLPFFEQLYKLQEINNLPCSENEYAKRLSVVRDVDSLGVTAQFSLENPKDIAKHWNPNYGSHGWHRYVGRFPPQLVRALINHFGAKRGEVVCDPFAGSGTTLVESRLLGLRGIGIEVCPLSCLISRTKSKFPLQTDSLEDTVRLLGDFYEQKWSRFVAGRNVNELAYQEILGRPGNSIPQFPNYDKWMNQDALLGSSIIVEFAESLSGYIRDAVCCALSASMRSIGNVDVDVVRAEYSKKPRGSVDVLKLVQRALRRMLFDIDNMSRTHVDFISSEDNIQVIGKSMLEAQISPGEIDYIITSPPYGVESLSYLRTHLLSYRCLQPILSYDPYSFNEKIIGAEYVDDNGKITPNWEAASYSPTFTNFFEGTMKGVDTKKLIQRKYMMMHFFDSMIGVGRQFRTWLHSGSRIAFVVGNKKIGEQVIPTDTIICEIFEKLGFRFDNAISQKLKCNNSNSEVPWQEKIIQDEFVMLFSKQ